MAVTQAQTIDSWIRAPYTDDGWLSYTMNQDGTTEQQHPGNGVVLDAANTVQRFSVAKTQRSYDVDGVNAINGSLVHSLTPNMRQAYASQNNDGAITGARGQDRPQLLPT